MNAGICLNREGQGAVIAPTVRADLHWDRYMAQLDHIASIEDKVDKHGEFRPITPPTLIALFDMESAAAAAKVASVLNLFWKAQGRNLRNSAAILSETDAAFTIEHVATCWKLPPRASSAGNKQMRWHQHDVIDFDDVPDPSMSPAEYWHRLAQGDEIERFSTIVAPVNLTTLIGGLARIPKRKEVHEKAAELYKSLYERVVMMGNPKAIDYGSAVQVDNSRNTFFSSSSIDDASDRYKRAVRALGIMRAQLVDAIILQDQPISAIARRRHGNSGGQARKKVTDALAEGLDILAVHFELAGSATGSRKVTGWLSERLPLDLPNPVA